MSSVRKSVHAHVEHVFFYMFSLWDWTDNTIDVKWLHKQMESKKRKKEFGNYFPRFFHSQLFTLLTAEGLSLSTQPGVKKGKFVFWCDAKITQITGSPQPPSEKTQTLTSMWKQPSLVKHAQSTIHANTHMHAHTQSPPPLSTSCKSPVSSLLTGWILFLLREDGCCLAATDWLVDFVTWMPPLPPFPALIYQTVTHKANTATIWFIWSGPLTLSPFLHRYWPFFPGIKTF